MPLSEKKISSDYQTFTSSRRNLTKIVLLGDSEVGKTCLIERLVNSNFNPMCNATVGINLTTKKFSLGNNSPEILVFTDVSGSDRFADIRKAYYKGIEIVLAVCDLTNKKSLENLGKIWIPEFINSNPLEEGLRIKVQLIGNKYDLNNKIKISLKELEDTANRINSLFPQISFLKPCLFTSAKDNLNVNQSFGVPKGITFI